MAAEEDTELHDLVMDTLNKNGAMGKLKAQARASIIIALERERRKENISSLLSEDFNDYLKTSESSMMLSLLREFLLHFGLTYTVDVLECESYEGTRWKKSERDDLKRKFNLSESPGPLLFQLMKSLPFEQGGASSSGSKPMPSAPPANPEISQTSEGDSTPKVTPRDTMEATKLSVLNLPQLGVKNPLPQVAPDVGMKEVEEKLSKLGTEEEPDEYGEDFHSTSSLSAGIGGAGKYKENLADMLATDTEEPITEDIPEDFDADDLLNSSVSGLEELTGMETVSGVSGKSNDYMEDV